VQLFGNEMKRAGPWRMRTDKENLGVTLQSLEIFSLKD
jgi:hypothetical protein